MPILERLLSLVVAGWDTVHSMQHVLDSMGITDRNELRIERMLEIAQEWSPGFGANIPPSQLPALDHCRAALWEVEGGINDLKALDVPVIFYCGREDLYYKGITQLAKDTGYPLIEAEGDHIMAHQNVNQHLDEIFAFFARVDVLSV